MDNDTALRKVSVKEYRSTTAGSLAGKQPQTIAHLPFWMIYLLGDMERDRPQHDTSLHIVALPNDRPTSSVSNLSWGTHDCA